MWGRTPNAHQISINPTTLQVWGWCAVTCLEKSIPLLMSPRCGLQLFEPREISVGTYAIRASTRCSHIQSVVSTGQTDISGRCKFETVSGSMSLTRSLVAPSSQRQSLYSSRFQKTLRIISTSFLEVQRQHLHAGELHHRQGRLHTLLLFSPEHGFIEI